MVIDEQIWENNEDNVYLSLRRYLLQQRVVVLGVA